DQRFHFGHVGERRELRESLERQRSVCHQQYRLEPGHFRTAPRHWKNRSPVNSLFGLRPATAQTPYEFASGRLRWHRRSEKRRVGGVFGRWVGVSATSQPSSAPAGGIQAIARIRGCWSPRFDTSVVNTVGVTVAEDSSPRHAGAESPRRGASTGANRSSALYR